MKISFVHALSSALLLASAASAAISNEENLGENSSVGTTNFAAKNAENPSEKSTTLDPEGIPKTWIQGVPVENFEKDKVYVFEFWATWCGPCIAAIPHLEELHRKILEEKIDAKIVGINVFEKISVDALKKFLAKRKIPPSYAIAADNDENGRNVKKFWLEPLEISAIPHSLVVKNGEILWRGNPRELNFELIKSLAGTTETPEKISAGTPDKAFVQKEIRRIRKLFFDENFELGNAEIEKFLNADFASEAEKIRVAAIPLELNFAQENWAELNENLKNFVARFSENLEALKLAIRYILEGEIVPESARNLDLAEKCSARIFEILGPENSLPWEILAKIYVADGDFSGAILAQKNAVKYSAEAKFLKKISKQKENPNEPDFDGIFDEIFEDEIATEASKNQAAGTTNENFSDEKNRVPEKEKIVPEALKNLLWIQNEELAKIVPESTFFVEFWKTPPKGLLPNSAAEFRPAKWTERKLEAAGTRAPVFVLVSCLPTEKNVSELKKILAKKDFSTPHAVAIIDPEEAKTRFFDPLKIAGTQSGIAFRGDEVLWSGTPQDLPFWLVSEALEEDFDAAKSRERRARERELERFLNEKLSDAKTILRERGPHEAAKFLENLMSDFEKFPLLFSFAQEIRMGETYSKKNYEGAGKFVEETLEKFPANYAVANRQMKILKSNPEFFEANALPALKAAKNMILAKKRVPEFSKISDFYVLFAEISLENSFPKLAEKAAKKAVETNAQSQELFRLEKLSENAPEAK